MATKKKTEPKKTAPITPKWYVEELLTGQKKFYTAAKKIGSDIITRGGYWDTREEAQKLADKLNEEGKK